LVCVNAVVVEFGDKSVATGVPGDEEGADDGPDDASERSMETSMAGECAASRRYSETRVDVVDFVGEEMYSSGTTSVDPTGGDDLRSAPKRVILVIRDSYFAFHASGSVTSEVIVCWGD